MTSTEVTFKVTEPHARGLDHDWHEWFFPNGWRGIGPVERRDALGRAQGDRDGYFPEWLVLACNNSDCPGRAVVPLSWVLNHADAMDPEVTR